MNVQNEERRCPWDSWNSFQDSFKSEIYDFRSLSNIRISKHNVWSMMVVLTIGRSPEAVKKIYGLQPL